MQKVKYVVDHVVCRSLDIQADKDSERGFIFMDDPATIEFGGNIVDNFKGYDFVKPMESLDIMYKQIKRSLSFRVEPKIAIDRNKFIATKLAKGNGINPTFHEVNEWREGKILLRLIQTEFRVVKLVETVDFDIDNSIVADYENALSNMHAEAPHLGFPAHKL